MARETAPRMPVDPTARLQLVTNSLRPLSKTAVQEMRGICLYLFSRYHSVSYPCCLFLLVRSALACLYRWARRLLQAQAELGARTGVPPPYRSCLLMR